jgi:hypothetical protein
MAGSPGPEFLELRYQARTGRLSSLWQDAQAEWIAKQSTRYKHSPIRWVGCASLALLEISWQMWDHRNHIYHDPAHPWSVQRSQDISQQIISTLGAHNNKEILKRDRHLFSISPQVLTQSFSDADKHKWMASVTAAYSRFHHYQAVANQRDPQQSSLTPWLFHNNPV